MQISIQVYSKQYINLKLTFKEKQKLSWEKDQSLVQCHSMSMSHTS